MQPEVLKKYGSLAIYIVLAGISCWATAHSFHLLIKWMPEAFVWIITIAFFIVASYGTKLIFDGFNGDRYNENRVRNFWMGIVLFVVFWLFMSMPTNTHTFFYNHNVGNKVQDDISTTIAYLEQIKGRANISTDYNKVHDDVNKKFNSLSDEYNGIGKSGMKGNGQYVRQQLRDINAILEKELPGSAIKFNDDTWNGFNPSVLSNYEDQMNAALVNIKDANYKVSKTAAAEAEADVKKLSEIQAQVKAMVEAGSIDEEVVTQADGLILSGYSCIKNNQTFVNFKNEADKELYTAENLETLTKRMLSVIDVWIDFFGGKYPLSFCFYILLSVLVDVAAFLFFDFAFKSED